MLTYNPIIKNGTFSVLYAPTGEIKAFRAADVAEAREKMISHLHIDRGTAADHRAYAEALAAMRVTEIEPTRRQRN